MYIPHTPNTHGTYPTTCVFSVDTQWKLQVSHDLTFGATRHKTVVKRTAIGKRLRFFFTMFSTSVSKKDQTHSFVLL